MDLHEKAIKLWEHLAETGLSKSRSYKELKFSTDENECPACQYVLNITTDYLDCGMCPVRNSWVKSNGIGFVESCEGDNSAFRKWTTCKNIKRRKELASYVLESVRDWWEEVE